MQTLLRWRTCSSYCCICCSYPERSESLNRWHRRRRSGCQRPSTPNTEKTFRLTAARTDTNVENIHSAWVYIHLHAKLWATFAQIFHSCKKLSKLKVKMADYYFCFVQSTCLGNKSSGGFLGSLCNLQLTEMVTSPTNSSQKRAELLIAQLPTAFTS